MPKSFQGTNSRLDGFDKLVGCIRKVLPPSHMGPQPPPHPTTMVGQENSALLKGVACTGPASLHQWMLSWSVQALIDLLPILMPFLLTLFLLSWRC